MTQKLFQPLLSIKSMTDKFKVAVVCFFMTPILFIGIGSTVSKLSFFSTSSSICKISYIVEVLLLLLGVIGIWGLLTKRIFGKWTTTTFLLVVFGFLSNSAIHSGGALKSSLFENRLDDWAIIQFLFHPAFALSLLGALLIILSLSISRKYFVEW